MFKVTIDKQVLYAKPDTRILEVAEQLGIYIPTLCYHKKLGIIASCRICLVEIVGSAKLVPACSTLIQNGMQVITNSPKVLNARRAVLELLLINHPLDCPICDKAGACTLQDLVVQYGNVHSAYREEKRAVCSQNFSPLIKTSMTRCIHCMRCVKFCRETAGSNELALTNYGEHITIASAPHARADSGVVGNIVDLCPVGALLPKSEAIFARNWELTCTNSVSPHDCLGSNISIYSAQEKIVRIAARENNTINETWISDRERFSHEAIMHNERLTMPLFKHKGKWIQTSWEEALHLVDRKFKEIAKVHGEHELGGLISSSATLEEQYLLQKYLRHFGSNNIDHRLWQLDFTGQELASLYPSLGIPIEELEKQQLLFIIGANIPKAQPILGLKLRKLTTLGGCVCVLNPMDINFNFPVAIKHIANRGDLVTPLLGIVKALLKKLNVDIPHELQELVKDIVPSTTEKKLASTLLSYAHNKLLVLGDFALSHPQAFLLTSLSNLIAKLVGAHCGMLTKGANAAGAWFTGCVPHRLPGGQALTALGKNAKEMLTTPLKGYILFRIEELDTIFGEQAVNTIRNADFTVALTCFSSTTMLDIADVLLPITTFAEMSGTYINAAGTWQTFAAAIRPWQHSLSGWEIINSLGTMADATAFAYKSRSSILMELNNIAETNHKNVKLTDAYTFLTKAQEFTLPVNSTVTNDTLVWLAEVPMLQIDPLVRRATALQKINTEEKIAAKINRDIANKMQLRTNDLVVIKVQNGKSISLPIVVDDRIPTGSIYMDCGISETLGLGMPYSEVIVEARRRP